MDNNHQLFLFARFLCVGVALSQNDILKTLFMFNSFIKPRQVVITGFGCVTPIGIGREVFWKALRNGESGVGRIESFDVSESKVKIAAEVKNFDWEAELDQKTASTLHELFRWRWRRRVKQLKTRKLKPTNSL